MDKMEGLPSIEVFVYNMCLRAFTAGFTSFRRFMRMRILPAGK